jgi:hypothetical protein
MLTHFVAPTPTYRDNIETYRSIFETILAEGHSLTRDFGAEVATQIEMGLNLLDQDDWETLYNREMAYLSSADALIVDATNKSTFGVGYQAAIALAQQKPVLLLLREGSLGGSFVSGLTNPNLTRRSFNDTNLTHVIRDFCNSVGKTNA